MSDSPVDYLTVEEAADILRASPRSVARLLKTGQLPGVFLGTREGWRIRRADVETWTTNRPRADFMRLPTHEEQAELRARKQPAKRPPKRAKRPKQEDKPDANTTDSAE